MWFVETRDEAGQPSVGSAFVVFSDAEQSFLIASYNTVRANTQEPAPGIDGGEGRRAARGRPRPVGPGQRPRAAVDPEARASRARWVPDDPPPQVGDRVFVVSGLGAGGGAVSQGFIADVSADGIQHDAPVGAAFQGGPLVNSDGEVLGVASRAVLAARVRARGGVLRGPDPQQLRRR